MNQKNSLGLNNCFKDLENPIDLFEEWFKEAKKTEINDSKEKDILKNLTSFSLERTF